MAGCGQPTPPQPPPTPETSIQSAPSGPIRFTAQELAFQYERGESGFAWPVEVTGGGVALRDFDGDGDLDLFFAQGMPLPVGRTDHPPADVLLRNDGERRFTDVSAAWGLTPKGYGQGVAVADYDGDGDPDVYVTRYGANTLWRNDGGRFTDVTAEAGVGCPLWSLGAAFLDYDDDGDLDLFVANYFDFDEAAAPFAYDANGQPDYGTPARFPGQPDVLYRNDGDGHFTDVTASAGVAGSGRGMGVLAADLDGDHRIDLLVANDAEANAAWINRGDGTFDEAASRIGLDLNAAGQAEANMGIAFGDTDGDAVPDIVISHFVGEHDTLWRARGQPGSRFYQDETYAAGLGSASKPFTGWGIALADFDLDGLLDLLVTNGQIRREPGQPFPYENPPLLWHGLAGGRFDDVTDSAGPYFRQLHMGRGLAIGDLDDDGDPDAVITHHQAPAVVLWNESPRSGHWLRVELRGHAPNRDALGAEVTLEAGGRTFFTPITSGGSYLSAHDPRPLFGLGPCDLVDRLTIRWPSGQLESHTKLPVNQSRLWLEPAD